MRDNFDTNVQYNPKDEAEVFCCGNCNSCPSYIKKPCQEEEYNESS